YTPAGNQSVSLPRGGAAESATQLVARVIEAKGGLARLKALKTITVTARATGLGDNASQPAIETMTQLAYPNQVRVETTSDRGGTLQVFDGTTAWLRDPRGTREVPERMKSDLEMGLQRDTISALLAVERGDLRARVLPDVRREVGATLRAVEVSGPRLEPMVLYVDAETGRIARQTYVAGGMGSPLVEEEFDDYRMVDGVSIAFKATVRVGGRPVIERRVLDVIVDRPLSPQLFKRPS
ncbi:MAG: hypothetical protein ABL961_05410, partial [Vicinamibacterales bacterium]